MENRGLICISRIPSRILFFSLRRRTPCPSNSECFRMGIQWASAAAAAAAGQLRLTFWAGRCCMQRGSRFEGRKGHMEMGFRVAHLTYCSTAPLIRPLLLPTPASEFPKQYEYMFCCFFANLNIILSLYGEKCVKNFICRIHVRRYVWALKQVSKTRGRL